MKRITVAYWKEHGLIPYFDNNCTFDYSPAKQAELTSIIIEAGYSAMLRPNMGLDKDVLLIYIDKGRFGQT